MDPPSKAMTFSSNMTRTAIRRSGSTKAPGLTIPASEMAREQHCAGSDIDGPTSLENAGPDQPE